MPEGVRFKNSFLQVFLPLLAFCSDQETILDCFLKMNYVSGLYLCRKELYDFLPMKKKNKKETEALRSELEIYKKPGVALWLDGQPGTPKSISKACVIAEEGTYMRDYIRNEEGELERIQFDFVTER